MIRIPKPKQLDAPVVNNPNSTAPTKNHRGVVNPDHLLAIIRAYGGVDVWERKP